MKADQLPIKPNDKYYGPSPATTKGLLLAPTRTWRFGNCNGLNKDLIVETCQKFLHKFDFKVFKFLTI